MNEPADPNAELMNELRSILERVDPPPGEISEFARAALGWRRLDGELAELLADSALETGATALARSGSAGGRWLTFKADGLAIDLQIEADGGVLTLLGQLAPPPAAAAIEVQTGDGAVAATADADSLGRFRVKVEARGRIRLRVLRPDPPGAPIETSWFSV
jgi:hypothetical protein